MPYIPKEHRKPIDDILIQLPRIEHAGQLNYVISEVISRYLMEHGINYQSLNDVAGVLVNIKTEYDRKVLIPYERSKEGNDGNTPGFIELNKKLLELGCEVGDSPRLYTR